MWVVLLFLSGPVFLSNTFQCTVDSVLTYTWLIKLNCNCNQLKIWFIFLHLLQTSNAVITNRFSSASEEDKGDKLHFGVLWPCFMTLKNATSSELDLLPALAPVPGVVQSCTKYFTNNVQNFGRTVAAISSGSKPCCSPPYSGRGWQDLEESQRWSSFTVRSITAGTSHPLWTPASVCNM